MSTDSLNLPCHVAELLELQMHISANVDRGLSGQTCEEIDGHGEAGADAGLLKKRLRLR